VKLLLGKFPRYSRHVLRGPCKDIPILTEELDELAFSRRNSTSSLSYLLLSPAPMMPNLLGSEGSRMIFLLSLAAWNEVSSSDLLVFVLGMGAFIWAWAMATTLSSWRRSASMTRESASLEPTDEHARDFL